MLRELLSLFRSSDSIVAMARDFSQMLDASHELTVRAGRLFFDESDVEGERGEISRRDVAINKLERSIRRQLITHLTVGHESSDVPYCLLLMSLVKDVERIGDYAKNLAEVREEGGAPVPDDEFGTELRELRGVVEGMFSEVSRVFTSSDAEAAAGLIARGRAVNRRCDALIASVARSDHDAATTTSIVLGARYYKRIGSHLLNVLSGVVMPLHKLDYYDEDVLGGAASDANDEED